jgi:ketosteroid isomerase-like protein
MKLIYALFLAVLFASPVYAGDVNSEIAQEFKTFEKTYNAHDFKALGQFYAEDAVVYAQGVDITKGREAIQKHYASFLKDVTDMKADTLAIVDAGDHAIEYGKWSETYQGKPDQGIYITVYKKKNGKWKIIRSSSWSNPSTGQAIALDPNDPEGHIMMAWALTIGGGSPTEALNFIAAAIRLNPNYPSHYPLAHGVTLFATGDVERAAAVLDEGFKRNPHALMLLPPLASTLALLDRREEAHQKLLIWRPGVSQLSLENLADNYNFPFRWEREYVSVRERFIDGLRIAGLPLNVTVTTLIAELKSDDPFRRLITAKRLGWFGHAAAPAVPALIAALEDEAVREEAVKSLGKIGPEAKAAMPALTAIQNESLIGIYAKEALIEIGRN